MTTNSVSIYLKRDAVRDNEVTNALEIKDFGWAFGQMPVADSLSVIVYSPGSRHATRGEVRSVAEVAC